MFTIIYTWGMKDEVDAIHFCFTIMQYNVNTIFGQTRNKI